MKYLSTRGHADRKQFCDILLEGLAPDGGLYLPEHYPQVDDAMLQREADEVGGEGSTQTDLIILTHDTREGTMDAVIAQMQALPTVLAPITRIRKEELN